MDSLFLILLKEIWKWVLSLKYAMRSTIILEQKCKKDFDLLKTKCGSFIMNSHWKVWLKRDQTSKRFKVTVILDLIRTKNFIITDNYKRKVEETSSRCEDFYLLSFSTQRSVLPDSATSWLRVWI